MTNDGVMNKLVFLFLDAAALLPEAENRTEMAQALARRAVGLLEPHGLYLNANGHIVNPLLVLMSNQESALVYNLPDGGWYSLRREDSEWVNRFYGKTWARGATHSESLLPILQEILDYECGG